MSDVFGSALHAMGVTFTMIGSGTFMRACGVISPVGQREMAQVAMQFLLPAFNFSALIADVSWSKLVASRVVALFSALHVALGLLLGCLLCAVGCRSDFLRGSRSQVLVLCAFCNGTAMPLPLFRALLAHPRLQAPGAEAEGSLAITVYGTVWRFLLWTVGIAILESGANRGGEEGKGLAPGRLLRRVLLNANTCASAAGLAIALSGAADVVLGGPLAFLREACANVAKASHTMLLLTLGAALWPIPSITDWRAILGVCGVKLVAMPALTLGLLSLAEPTPTVGLVLAIEGCVPSALQVSMMIQSTGQDARHCTVICFWQHAVALLTMTAFLALALKGLP
mmetsp:Transcript_76524/g.236963  ORF Transcript_76524/g.236963 Transcript_76524/m.236963 type:complete len:340 (-) Transcript_76524:305-1324(-)|eukprot:CAMPEP_0204573458 /NCGR_PEP_ID=MMETSP0661-20131031/40043_1 /ASSEMBLY_ACC=CAM_ASM_000606 /TAXON_ID=109239 /ORGANISM="Alexandrium margalefi, Strain AMGDE01CS-322" /LENGTH=339 /DNA_ID=CAMNT_0051581895 /DNA_START=43 /DNA_END=1062 /DNA_ORIENTATION=+